MRTIKLFDFGCAIDGVKSIRVQYNNVCEEYQVQFLDARSGKPQESKTYFASDKEDALDTAQFEFNRHLGDEIKLGNNFVPVLPSYQQSQITFVQTGQPDGEREVFCNCNYSGIISKGWLRSGGDQWVYVGELTKGLQIGEKTLDKMKNRLRRLADGKVLATHYSR